MSENPVTEKPPQQKRNVSKQVARRAGRKASRKGKKRERLLAKVLSNWWTNKQDPKAFRRTPLSGGFPKKRATGDIMPVSQEAQTFPFVVDVKDRKVIQTFEFTDLVIAETSPIFKWFDELTEIIAESPMFLSGKLRLLVIHKNQKDYGIIGAKEHTFIEMHAGALPHVKVRHPWRYETLYIFPLEVLLQKDPETLKINARTTYVDHQ